MPRPLITAAPPPLSSREREKKVRPGAAGVFANSAPEMFALLSPYLGLTGFGWFVQNHLCRMYNDVSGRGEMDVIIVLKKEPPFGGL